MSEKEVEKITETESKVRAIEKFVLTGNVKMQFERNHIEAIVRSNPELKPRHIIEYIHKAQRTGADPALDQIYLLPFRDYKTGEMEASVVFSYHFIMGCAAETGEWAGASVETLMCEKFAVDKSGKVQTVQTPVARAVVYRLKGGQLIESPYEARFDEYASPKAPIWKKMPQVMLEKCAMLGATRRAFPEVTRGMHAEEEMNKDLNINTDEREVKDNAMETLNG